MKRCMLPSAALLALFAVAVALLTSCGNTATLEREDTTVTMTDALGREVCLMSKPTRVAALLGSFADVWVLAGGELCAAAEDAQEDFGLEMNHAVNLGGAHSPSLEMLLSANPDLVLASASTASHVAMLTPLESAGITVLYCNVDNFNDYLAMLDLCTDLTGRKDLYEQNGIRVQEQIQAIKEAYATANPSEREQTVLLLRASSGAIKAKGSEGTILGEMLADMGCINIADSETSLLENLSVEAVIRRDPHRIFVVTVGASTEAALASLDRLMEENSAWGTLEAVREGRLHIMEKSLFNLKPNDRWGEAYQKLYETLIQD
jgi:iron complex transport system substrate-binding protein